MITLYLCETQMIRDQVRDTLQTNLIRPSLRVVIRGERTDKIDFDKQFH